MPNLVTVGRNLTSFVTCATFNMQNAYTPISIFLASKVCPMLKYSDIYVSMDVSDVMPRQYTSSLTIQWHLKNWTDNFFQIFVMGTSWVALSINNIKTRACREMTKNIEIFYFNGKNVAKHWHVAGEVFAISDCLVYYCYKPH